MGGGVEGNRKLNRIRNLFYFISRLVIHGIQIGEYDLIIPRLPTVFILEQTINIS